MLCHNIRLADPDDAIVKEIQALTSKRKKTEEDRKAIARLEWFGGLYTMPGIPGPTVPTANVRQTFIEAAKVNRLGTAVSRSFHPVEFHVPIQYDGPRDLDALYELPAFQDRRAVGVSGSRTMRTRPCFPAWSLALHARLLDDIMDLADFEQVVEKAGIIQGLNDNRINGFGRFEGKVTAL